MRTVGEHDPLDATETPRYAGAWYPSRLNLDREYERVFVDLLGHHIVRGGAVIHAAAPGLYEASALLSPGIEDDHGRRRYLLLSIA